jgi:mRNA interferase MazF
MNRGEVWWVNFEPALGSEITKIRPAVIISNNSANRNLSRIVVIPLTSNTGRQYPGEAIITVNNTPSKAMADQIMTADKIRFKNKYTELSNTDLLAVEDAIKLHLGFSR